MTLRELRTASVGPKLNSFLVRWALLFVCVLVPPLLAAPRIPRLIFRSSEDDLASVHPRFLEFLNATTAHNPEYLQVYASARDRESFVRSEYPQYLSAYQSLLPGAYQSDLWRYLVVFRFGGIYNDMGMRYLRRVREVVRPDDEFVGAVDLDPTAVINGFFAAYPQHPILRKTISIVVDNIRNRRYGCDNLDITGPRAFGRAVRLFFGERNPHRPVATGSYTLHGGFRLHMLNFSISASPPDGRGGGRGSVWDRLQLISDHDGGVSLRNKFPGYLEAVYKNRSREGKYGDMHWQRRVYRQVELSGGAAFASASASVAAPHSEALYAHTSNLFRRGRVLWYHHNGTKFTFPDYATFLNMGLQECLAVLAVPPASTLHADLPTRVLAAAPGDVAANLRALGLWGGPDCNSSVPSAPPPLAGNPQASPSAASLARAVGRGLLSSSRTISWSSFIRLFETV